MIEVLATPPLNTVQDRGRFGQRCHGIGRTGAMDRVALAAANALLGNPEEAAGLEFQLFPVRLHFRADTAVALTGADAVARLDGRPLPPWWAFPVRSGQELVLEAPRREARRYLAVAGGIDVEPVLGSRATHMRAGLGGLNGRALIVGDRLPVGRVAAWSFRDAAGFGALPPGAAIPAPGVAADTPAARPGDLVLRVIPAAEHGQFDEASRTLLWSQSWSVTSQSNRMGYRLQGEAALRRVQPVEMRSHGIVPGVIQVPPAGQPIIQLEDGNSAGGYPKIGAVIEADLWRIAQATPGRALRFAPCTMADAREAERAVDAYLRELRLLARHARRPLGKAA